METYLYKTLTRTQRECPKSKTLTMGPYNVLFNKSLDRLRKDDKVKKLYRGVMLSKEDVQTWTKMGETSTIVCVPCHSSTSRQQNVGLKFLKFDDKERVPVLFCFSYPDGINGKTLTCPIAEYSVFPNEGEYIVDPEQDFFVKNVTPNEKYTLIVLEQVEKHPGRVEGSWNTLENFGLGKFKDSIYDIERDMRQWKNIKDDRLNEVGVVRGFRIKWDDMLEKLDEVGDEYLEKSNEIRC